jgi:hypothetical protein
MTSDEMTRMTVSSRTKYSLSRPLFVAMALSPLLTLGACMEGTELNGKVFDLLGVSSSSQERARAEPKMAPRSGLILPPNAERLPAPGSGGEQEAVVALNDPDKQKAVATAEKARLHKLYCSGELSWKQRLVDKDATPTSPYGTCTAFSDSIRPQ